MAVASGINAPGDEPGSAEIGLLLLHLNFYDNISLSDNNYRSPIYHVGLFTNSR